MKSAPVSIYVYNHQSCEPNLTSSHFG